MCPDPLHETVEDSVRGRARVPMATEAQLFVVLEGDRPLAGGSRHALEGVDEIVFGRGVERRATRVMEKRTFRLSLEIPGPSISRHHARIRIEGGRATLEDLGSKNGVFVNGARISSAELRDGDDFELGRTLFLYREAVDVPPGTAADVGMEELRAVQSGFATLVPAYASELGVLRRIASSAVPVLVLGATGTGKEVVARALHVESGRTGEFVAVNCGALPESLVESQLFGHLRGAFSGAVRDEPGLVRASSGGTLFLDEIGDLPLLSQAALLRVLQEGDVTPVGATRPIKVDLRVVSATHRPLEELVAQETFRKDLYARLAGLTVTLPPLHARRCDLGVLLAELFPRVAPTKAAHARIAPDAARALLAYAYPMNVRELQQCLSVAVVLAEDGVIELGHLPAPVVAALSATPGNAPSPRARVRSERPSPRGPLPDDVELRATLVTLLTRTRGNVSEMARVLGKRRFQIHRWLRRFELDLEAFRGGAAVGDDDD